MSFFADYSNKDSVDNEISDEEDSSDEDDDGDSSFDSVHKHHPKGQTVAKKNVKPVTAKPSEFSTNYPTTGGCFFILHIFFIQTTVLHCLILWTLFTINTISVIWF